MLNPAMALITHCGTTYTGSAGSAVDVASAFRRKDRPSAQRPQRRLRHQHRPRREAAAFEETRDDEAAFRDEDAAPLDEFAVGDVTVVFEPGVCRVVNRNDGHG